jgi:hypothetical protein
MLPTYDVPTVTFVTITFHAGNPESKKLHLVQHDLNVIQNNVCVLLYSDACLLTNITVLDWWCMYKAPITNKNNRLPYHLPYTHVLEWITNRN